MKKKAWKAWVRDYLYFSKNERSGVLLLLAVMLAIKVVPYYWPAAPPAPVAVPDSLIVRLLEKSGADTVNLLRERGRLFNRMEFSTQDRLASSAYERSFEKRRPLSGALFPFNPNIATELDWQKLGVPAKTIGTILKYREKGGKFRSGEDLYRIYGMPKQLADRLIPMVRLESGTGVAIPTTNTYGGGNKAPSSQWALDKADNRLNSTEYGKREPGGFKSKRIQINQADSLDWLALPGIGPKLSGRILNYRNALGGFVRVEQVKEVYGLADSVFQQLLPQLEMDVITVRKLNPNAATMEELARHPYIRWKLAQAIVQYRNSNGPFHEMSDMGKIHLVDTNLLKKLGPYCEFK
jgi:DNA uptake protein ComE-like DNA-binding protein